MFSLNETAIFQEQVNIVYSVIFTTENIIKTKIIVKKLYENGKFFSNKLSENKNGILLS